MQTENVDGGERQGQEQSQPGQRRIPGHPELRVCPAGDLANRAQAACEPSQDDYYLFSLTQ
jgi:hypothetical protein